MKSIFYKTPYQQILVKEIKAPLNAAFRILTDPNNGRLAKLKALNVLRKLVIVINDLPEPTKDNTKQPNTHILIGIRDEFFRYFKLPIREKTLRAVVNFVIIIYDTDFYRSFIDWWVEELRKSNWKPLGDFQPDPQFFNIENEKQEDKS